MNDILLQNAVAVSPHFFVVDHLDPFKSMGVLMPRSVICVVSSWLSFALARAPFVMRAHYVTSLAHSQATLVALPRYYDALTPCRTLRSLMVAFTDRAVLSLDDKAHSSFVIACFFPPRPFECSSVSRLILQGLKWFVIVPL